MPPRHFKPQTPAQLLELQRRIDAVERQMIPAGIDFPALSRQYLPDSLPVSVPQPLATQATTADWMRLLPSAIGSAIAAIAAGAIVGRLLAWLITAGRP